MTVVNTPANITTYLDLTNADPGHPGHDRTRWTCRRAKASIPTSKVTIGNGTLTGHGQQRRSSPASVTSRRHRIHHDDPRPGRRACVGCGRSHLRHAGAETITGLTAATIAFNGQSTLNLYTPAGSTDTVYQSVDTFNLYAGAGSTVNVDQSAYTVNDLTVLGAAVVNVAQGDPTFIDYGAGEAGSLNIEADPATPPPP